eukprot:g1521.t1
MAEVLIGEGSFEEAAAAAQSEAAAAVAAITDWRADNTPSRRPHNGPKGSGAAAGNIKVCVRKRPLSGAEAAAVGTADDRGRHEFEAVTVSNPAVWFHQLEYAGREGGGDGGGSRLRRTGGVEGKKFLYHHTFSEVDDNDAVYAGCVQDLVPFVLKGGTATCVAYGQTGAGKTFTQVGMQDRLARDLLAGAARNVARGKWPEGAAGAEFSFFENQGERCYDLQNARQELVLREDGAGVVHVTGLTSVRVGSVEELHAALAAANTLRATAPTQSHPHSSRSHAICTVRVGPAAAGGTLRVVDLAGCERHESTSLHTPERIAEMRDINWSLGCLKECIRLQREALNAPRRPPARAAAPAGSGAASASGQHIPYRRSKLTMLLKDCFTEPKVQTVFLAHVAPTHRSGEYTKNTLEYAAQMLAVSEKKKASVHGVVLPDRWSKRKFAEWLAAVDGGRFAQHLEIMQITGATFKHMPLQGKQGLTMRLEANGMSFGEAEAEATAMRDAFQREVAAAKAAVAKAQKKSGAAAAGPSLATVDPQLLAEMLAYYAAYNPAFANEGKCSSIARAFMSKAKKAGDPQAWKEMLYAALGAKDGCDDPRVGLVCPAHEPACAWSVLPPSTRTGYVAKDLTLDTYMPAAAAPSPRPAIICIHGGGYTGGDSKHENCNVMGPLFASAGFAAFSINYRLRGDAGNVPQHWPANCGNPAEPQCANSSAPKGDLKWMPTYAYPAVRDAKAAVRWVRSRAADYGVDAGYITVYGGSAGGTTVTALGLLREQDYKDEIPAAQDPTLATTNPGESSAVAAVVDHWGSDWMARQLWQRGAGNGYARGNPPIAIFHGTEDTTVPYSAETSRIVAGYNSTGAPYALFPIAGAGHGAWGADARHGLTSCRGPACSNLLDTTPLEEDHVTFQFVVQQLKLDFGINVTLPPSPAPRPVSRHGRGPGLRPEAALTCSTLADAAFDVAPIKFYAGTFGAPQCCALCGGVAGCTMYTTNATGCALASVPGCDGKHTGHCYEDPFGSIPDMADCAATCGGVPPSPPPGLAAGSVAHPGTA